MWWRICPVSHNICLTANICWNSVKAFKCLEYLENFVKSEDLPLCYLLLEAGKRAGSRMRLVLHCIFLSVDSSSHQNMSPSTLNYLTLSHPYPLPDQPSIYTFCIGWFWNCVSNHIWMEYISKSFWFPFSFCKQQIFDQFCLRTSDLTCQRPPKAIQGRFWHRNIISCSICGWSLISIATL